MGSIERLLDTYGVGILVIIAVTILLSFIYLFVVRSNKHDVDMAKAGRCQTHVIGSEGTVWKPCI